MKGLFSLCILLISFSFEQRKKYKMPDRNLKNGGWTIQRHPRISSNVITTIGIMFSLLPLHFPNMEFEGNEILTMRWGATVAAACFQINSTRLSAASFLLCHGQHYPPHLPASVEVSLGLVSAAHRAFMSQQHSRLRGGFAWSSITRTEFSSDWTALKFTLRREEKLPMLCKN